MDSRLWDILISVVADIAARFLFPLVKKFGILIGRGCSHVALAVQVTADTTFVVIACALSPFLPGTSYGFALTELGAGFMGPAVPHWLSPLRSEGPTQMSEAGLSLRGMGSKQDTRVMQWNHGRKCCCCDNTTEGLFYCKACG